MTHQVLHADSRVTTFAPKNKGVGKFNIAAEALLEVVLFTSAPWSGPIAGLWIFIQHTIGVDTL